MNPESIETAARELFERHGGEALRIVTERVESLAQAGDWPQHAIASRLLTAVEHLLRKPASSVGGSPP